ncbi:MAG: glycosyl hydrolase [Candidatus Lokiarchaeota archaeon]|nr:glycosyl hydrolase [Candidatus Lokiarchaeota archaeon]MBD3342973.1 glycosyl hydrolase [Candidatus Lokiarchaeota archaeon]
MSKEYTKEELATLPFNDKSLDLEERIEDLLNRLTLEEKFRLLAGRRLWYTKPIERLGIKPFAMTDGPHGLGAHSSEDTPCTYFPTAICRAATWNPDLSYQFGKALAEEVRAINYHMILAPGINIDRTPINGRTFEYQAEDPYLNVKLAVPVIKGVQDQKIAACVKHYACNNQEINRFTVSSEVGERALQEIYLPAFKATVIKADAWSFMACYNKVNGTYGCEHEGLLRDRLMNNWGFRGFVVSDWGATKLTTGPASCINAGLSLEMPRTIQYKRKYLKKAHSQGKIDMEALDDDIKRLLRVMFLVGLFDNDKDIPKGSLNTKDHQAIARQIAEEGIVLLKNENSILPLDINRVKKITVLGPNKDYEMAMDGGSSQVHALYEITPIKGLKEKCEGKIEIIDDPAEADYVILCMGLNHEPHMDCENADKKTLDLPEDQIDLIKSTAQTNPNTIVVLINGSPITMDGWLESVPAVVEAWYSGMEAGKVIASILFGEINPSGKLPITFPKKLSDSPAHASERTYPGNDKVYYDEGIFVGYRHFDKEDIEPLFPFGFGLSYTSFEYKNLRLNKEKISADEVLEISLDISNIGERAGADIIQLYLQDLECSSERPPKELKGFQKHYLNPGETKSITFSLQSEDLKFYSDKENRWMVEDGKFNLLIGASSSDIRLSGEFEYAQ